MQNKKYLELKRNHFRSYNNQLKGVELEEFNLLVNEVSSKGFSGTWQVSEYIVKNRLGDKYQNISGILKMTNGKSTWNFNGGFPPKIFAMLCKELGLGHKGTDSTVVSFKSFKNVRLQNENTI